MRLPSRFSLATLLGLTTLVAGGFAVWRAYIWEPPTHKIALYERAPGTKGRFIDVGPNQIGFHLLARNARDGSIHYDAVRSAGGKLATTDQQTLKSAAPWLDVVQIELDPGPDRVDIIECRVFDHQSHELLVTLDHAYGWRVTASDAIQVYGLGKSLPPKVDVWFRAHSYDVRGVVTTLAPMGGSTSAMGEGSIKLADIRAGSWNFDGKQFTRDAGDRPHRISTILELRGPEADTRFQIAAVTKSGAKAHPDVPHFLKHYAGAAQRTPVTFDVALEELSHFEIRSFGGRSTFFFDGVVLPQPSAKGFGLPPVAKVVVMGRETTSTLTDFAPFAIRVSLRDGKWANGVSASNNWAAVMSADAVTDLGDAFTLDYSGVGVGALALKFNFIDAATGKPIKEQDLKRRGNSNSHGATAGAGYSEFGIPLKNVGSVEVTLGK